MPTIRLALAEQIESRDGGQTKDASMSNAWVDVVDKVPHVQKRFGTSVSKTLTVGQGQGMFDNNGTDYAIIGDHLYSETNVNFPYAQPSVLGKKYQSLGTSDGIKTVFKTNSNGYVFNNTTTTLVLGMTWTPQTSGITNFSVYDIAWNGTVYCAVGLGPTLTATTTCYTSPDGITWTARTLPSAYWDAIEWNGTVFCAISGSQAASTIAATSPDGITWTARTLPASAQWSDIKWNGTVFCAIAGYGIASNAAATSPDGITWTARTLPSSSLWMSISWNGSIFCAIVFNSTIAANSSDGITWTARTLPASAQWSSIAWNGTVFCAISGLSIASNVSAYSSDGITWTASVLPATKLWSSISNIGTIFCIVEPSSNNTYLSTDAITWTLISVSGATGGFSKVGNNGTNFVTIGNASPAITAVSTAPTIAPDPSTAITKIPSAGGVASVSMTTAGSGGTPGTYNLLFKGGGGSGAAGTYTIGSSITGPGITWTQRVLPSAVKWSSIAWNGTVFCAVGQTVATSPDGITWTNQAGALTGVLSSVYEVLIVWDGSVFCIVPTYPFLAASPVPCQTSPDGITWTNRGDVAFGGGDGSYYVAIGVKGSTICLSRYDGYTSISSDHGVTWTKSSSNGGIGGQGNGGALWAGVAANSSMFVAVGVFVGLSTTKTLATSTDGLNWTQRIVLPRSVAWSNIIYANSLFVAVGSNSKYGAYSSDGLTWTEFTLPLSANWSGIAWNGTVFCIVAKDNAASAISADAITWTASTIPGSINWVDVAGNASIFATISTDVAGSTIAASGVNGTGNYGSVISTNITTQGIGYATLAPTVTIPLTNNGGIIGATFMPNISNYPASSVPGLAFLDGTYYIMDSAGKIYGSELNDPLTWLQLTYINANSIPGTGVAIARYLNYIVAFKSNSTEMFYDAANALGSPLSIVANAVSKIGCAHSDTIVNIDNQLIFMSTSQKGGNAISLFTGTEPTVISTSSIDRIINQTLALSANVYSYGVKISGHNFYVLTLTYLNITLAYDIGLKHWAKWTYLTAQAAKSPSLTYANGIVTAVLASHGYSDGYPVTIAGAVQTGYNGTYTISYVDANTFTYAITTTPVSPATGTITSTGYNEGYMPFVTYFGDSDDGYLQHESDGKIYQVDKTLFQDSGVPLTTSVRTKLFDGGNSKRKRVSDVEIIGDKSTATVYFRYTDDDYTTYCGYKPVYMTQVRKWVKRNGSTMRRAFELRHNDNTDFRVESLQVNIDTTTEE